ncbi:protein anachronism isoform X2 [Scaptodrosophila lebanonensis]|uniref:Protein anachronism isoform X2 n=1 Tax=Drosophila lebanonensis TaxID=7225 RepID=A0A6J2U7I5_DROLE|nr:protein anachronism isoform X2 [Scaptodrosophila lebanonensis]
MSSASWTSYGRANLLLLLSLLLLWLVDGGDGARINRSALLDNVRSEYIDPNNRTIWTMFNLTEAQVSRIRAGSNVSGKEETTQAINNQLLNHIRSQRLNEIRNQIENAVSNKSDDKEEKPTSHEVAGYPVCNAETSAWQHSNNVTLEFSSSVFECRSPNLTLESATLRLFKLNPKGSSGSPPSEESASKPTTGCASPLLESQIRITVSVVLQLKKKRKQERKKRICNTMMLSSSKSGWVEIDIKCAIQYWEQQQSQPQHAQPPFVIGLLMIEVHDDEENPLKPGLYFQPPKCEQVQQSHGASTDRERLCLMIKKSSCQEAQG